MLLLLGSMAGYRLRPALVQDEQRPAYLACLGALMIPFQVIMVPFLRMMVDLSLTNTYWGLILAYTSLFLPFTVYLMASFYRRIPRSITEAATIDGASVWDIYRQIILPIGKPALLSVGDPQRRVLLERRARLAARDAAGAEADVDDRRVGACAVSTRRTSRSSPPAS